MKLILNLFLLLLLGVFLTACGAEAKPQLSQPNQNTLVYIYTEG